MCPTSCVSQNTDAYCKIGLTRVLRMKRWKHIRKSRLGKTNTKREMLLEFCSEKNVLIANSLFKQHQQREYT
jgi:hypothetical protein